MINKTLTVKRTGKKALMFASFFALFLITSCENFMNGNNSFLKNLEDQISVANAPVITVRLQPILNSGTTVPAPGDISFKLNVVKQLEFTVNADTYVFDHWAVYDRTAYDAGARIELTDAVTFSDSKNPKTNATVIKNTANLMIVPVSLAHPVLTLKAETGTGTVIPTAPITAKVNSPYDIEFAANESTYVFDHWGVFDKTDYEAGKREELADKVSFTNSKNPKAKVSVIGYYYNLLIVPMCFEHPILTLETPEDTGTLTPSGEKVLEIDEPFSITMRCSERYSFVRWAAYIVSGEEEVETDTALIFGDAITTSDLSSSTVIATLKERRSDIVIRPIVQRRPSVTFETLPNSGVISPAGEKLVNLNEAVSVSMTCSNSHGFIRWAAYVKSGETYTETDAVTFSQVSISPNFANATATATMTRNLENVVIRPVTEVRPAVNLTVPSNSSVNIVKNTGIRINFTQPLEPDTFTDFSNIKIQGCVDPYADDLVYIDLSSYFKAPSLSAPYKTLRIDSDADSGTYIPDYMSVIITVLKETTSASGLPMINDYSFTFKVSAVLDTNPPSISDIFVAKDDTLPQAATYKSLSAAGSIPLAKANRVRNSVYIGIQSTNAEEGDYTASYTITETLVNVPGSASVTNLLSKYDGVSAGTAVEKTPQGGTPKTANWFTWNLLTPSAYGVTSGVVKLSIIAKDSHGNATTPTSEHEFYIIFDQNAPGTTGFDAIPSPSGHTTAGWFNGNNNTELNFAGTAVSDTQLTGATELYSDTVYWQFSADGTTWTTQALSTTPVVLDINIPQYAGLTDGPANQIWARLVDDVGNTAQQAAPVTYKLDKTPPPPPVIAMTAAPWAFADMPNAKYWIKQDGTINYTLSLSGYDLSDIVGYLVDSPTGTPETGTTFTVGTGGDIPDYGDHTMYAVDGAGNVSTTGTTFWTFEDSARPEITSMKLSTGQTSVYPTDTTAAALETYWTKNSSVLFTLSMADAAANTSGIYGYTTDDGATNIPGYTLTLNALDDDDPSLTTVKAVDNVGNVSADGIELRVIQDTTKPVLETLTASGTNGGTGYVNIEDDYKVNVTIPFTETRSGVRDIQFHNTICSSLTGITVKNNGAELVLDDEYEISGKSIRFTPPLKISPLEIEGITINTGDAEKDLMPALVDAVNNQGDKGELKFKLDTTRPVVTAVNPEIFPGTSSYFNNTQNKYYLNTNAASVIYFKPEASDLNGISVYNSTGLLTGVGLNVAIPLGVGENQGLYAVDTAKNVSLPLTVTIVEDITPPSKPVISASGFKFFIKEGYLYDKSLVQKNYTLTSTDSGSSIYYYYIGDLPNPTKIEGTLGQPAVLPVDKGVTFKVTAKDRVGNVSDGLTLTSVGDITPPIILDEALKDTLIKGNKNDGTPPEQADFSSDNTVDAVIYFGNENTPAESAGVRFIRFLYSGAGAYLNVAEVTEVLDGDNNPIGFEIWKDNGNTYDIELKLSTSIHDSPITVKNLTIANTSGDGFYEPTIHYIADAVENVAAQFLPVAITIDSTPPTITAASITSTVNIKEADGIYYYNDIDGNPATTDTVPITLTMSDTNLYGYSLNGAAAVSGTSLNYTAAADDTTYDLVFKAVDKAGNLSTGSQSIKVRKDTAKPTSTISLYSTNGGNDYLNIDDDYKVNATVTFTRDNVGVNKLTFTGITSAAAASVLYNGASADISAQDSNTITLTNAYTSGTFTVEGLEISSTEGDRTIGVILTDAIGNVQAAVATDSINQDRTPPSITRITAIKPEDSNNSTYDGTPRADNPSNKPDWANYRSGAHFYTSKPRIRVGISSGVYAPSETLQGFRVKSTGSISTDIYTSYDFWIVDTYGGQPRDNISGKTQYLYAVDLAGNMSTVEFYFDAGSDTTPPLLELGALSATTGIYPTTAPVESGEDYYSRSGTLTFPLTMSDAGSGLFGYKISEGSTVASPIDTSSATAAFTGVDVSINGSEGTGTLNYIYSVDNVGNLSTAKTVRVIKDSTAPQKNSGVLSFYETTDTSFTTSIIATKNSSVSIKMTDLTEASSGIKVVTITGLANTEFTPVIKIGATQVFNTPVTPSGGSVLITLDTPRQITNGTVTITGLPITEVDGSKTITVQFTDAVDNTEAVNSTYSASVYYDYSSPIVTDIPQIDGVTGGFTNNLNGHSFAFTTHDAGSGVKTVTLSGADFTYADCDEASTLTPISTTGCTLNFTTPITSATPITVTGITLTTSNAVNTITASIVDALGNTPTETSASITHDGELSVTLNSVVSSIVTDREGFTGSTLVDLSFTPTADLSGIVSIDFTNCTDVANITSAAVIGGDRDGSKFTFAIPITEASPLTIEDISITGGTDGLKTIRPVFTDKAGNTFTPTSEGTITYDSTAPLNNSGEMTFHLVDDTDFATPITATKSTSAHIKITKLTESSSGIKTIRISGLRDMGSFGPIVKINGSSVYSGLPDVTGGITTFNLSSSYQITDGTVTISGLPITISQDDKEIAVEFIDAVGKTNESSKYTASIRLDYTAPSASAFTLAGANGGTGYINGSDSLTATATIITDADASGVKKITFSTDETGFDSLATTEVSINGAAPLSLITSGVPTGDQFLLSGSTITLGTPITAASTITINGITVTSTDGEKDVDIVLTDLAGNTSASIDSGVFLDTEKPSISATFAINSSSTANTYYTSGTYYSSASSVLFDLDLSDTENNSYMSDIYGHVVDSGTPETGSTVELTSNAAETTYTIKAVDKAGNVSTDSVTIKTILHTTAPSGVSLALSGNTSGNANYVNRSDSQMAKAVIGFTKLTVGVNKLVFSGDISSISGAEVDDLDPADYTVDDAAKTITLVTPVTSTGGATPVPAALTVTGLTVTGTDGPKNLTVTLHGAVGNNTADSDSIDLNTVRPTITYSTTYGTTLTTGEVQFTFTNSDQALGGTVSHGVLTHWGGSCKVVGINNGSNTLTVYNIAGNPRTMTYTANFTGSSWTYASGSMDSNVRTIPKTAVPTPVTLGTKTTGTNADLFVRNYTLVPEKGYVFTDTINPADNTAAETSKPDKDTAVSVSLKNPSKAAPSKAQGLSLTSSDGSILFAPEDEKTSAEQVSSSSDAAPADSSYIEETDKKPVQEVSMSTVQPPAVQRQDIPAKIPVNPQINPQINPLALILGLLVLLAMAGSASVFAYLMIKKSKKVQ